MNNSETVAKRTHNEDLKEGNRLLSGNITDTLADPGAECFSHDDYEFLKFHGVYQQDDRDLRKTGKKYIMMVRVRMPGGTIQPNQYLVLDRLAETHANNTLRITSRQGLQFHGIIKSRLRETIREINEALLTTLAACGDVARNVMAPVTPALSPVVERVQEEARRVSQSLLPATPAYHEIWVEGQALKLEEARQRDFVDPLYGRQYLPRKFKVAFAVPPHNDVDVFTQCVGFIAVIEKDQLLGYNLVVGGGMGRSHGNQETFPRLADEVGFLPPDQVEKVARGVMQVFREYGDRTNRKHARLKYVLEERGVDWFRTELEKQTGLPLAPVRPYRFEQQGDRFGWHRQLDGRWFLGLHIEGGRIKDTPARKYKTALRLIAEQFRLEYRMTPSNNLLMVGVTDGQKDALTRLLAEQGIPVELAQQASAVRRNSMACVSMPTCGLGLAEAERYLPDLITQLDEALAKLGLGQEDIVIRMTGCPNGCARPYVSEVAFVGRAPGRYQLYLGGNLAGTRLNRLYKDSVKDVEILAELQPLFARFAAERQAGERFGDWCHRVILPSA
jgi:sulfite reductase (NADPH) hemoprotein beta-component